MENKKIISQTKGTSLFENGLIWFGAAISLAEILTGTYFAPLGFEKGVLAIVIGHVIGCVLLFLAGVIGARTRKSSMETTKMSFGQKGCILFALLNIVQLAGWTAIMIYDGSLPANELLNIGQPFWAILIGALIVLWAWIGIRNLGKLNTIAMSLLFLLTIWISVVLLSQKGLVPAGSEEAMSFGAAVELSVAMPLSWLPCISDYTREAQKPVKAAALSSVVYGLVSCWMYLIGMMMALFAGESDFARMLMKTGVGVIGLLIVILSTVTTTFLDAWSAGISSESIFQKADARWIAIAVAVLGTAGAMFFNMDNITDFLYFIGSVFAPMVAVQIADFFILHEDHSSQNFDWQNLAVWFIGFILYRYFMTLDISIGNTLPDMLVTCLIAVSVSKIRQTLSRRSSMDTISEKD